MGFMSLIAATLISAAPVQDENYHKEAAKRYNDTLDVIHDYFGREAFVRASKSIRSLRPSGHVSYDDYRRIADACQKAIKAEAKAYFNRRVFHTGRHSRITTIWAPDNSLHRRFQLNPAAVAQVKIQWTVKDEWDFEKHVGPVHTITLRGAALEIYLLQKGMGFYHQVTKEKKIFVLTAAAAKALGDRMGNGRAPAKVTAGDRDALYKAVEKPVSQFLKEAARAWKSRR